jgi:molybdenum cofactor synthesis domain-containing protein
MIRFAILTVSDRSARGERPDASGPALATAITSRGWLVIEQKIVPDEFESIKLALQNWCDSEKIDIILTTGGTGVAPRDITPEATLAVIERATPGISEAMRAHSLQVHPHAMLSRSVCGICRRTLILNLPGSPKGAIENFAVVAPVLPHAIELLKEDPDAETGHLSPLSSGPTSLI